MDMHHDRPRPLRERPPSWPRRNDDDGPQRRRWDREAEPFEDDALPELYPGALVMEDLTMADDDVGTRRILARYTVARLLVLSLDGTLPGAKLRTERQIALEHLGMLPDYDWERRALERLAVLCHHEATPGIIEAATIAAEAAAKRSHIMGAFSLYRTAYELAIAEKWWAEAAQVARGVAQLARLEEARHSIRLWRRRAGILEGRAAREAEAAAEIAERDAAEIADRATADIPDREADEIADRDALEIAERPTGEIPDRDALEIAERPTVEIPARHAAEIADRDAGDREAVEKGKDAAPGPEREGT